MTELLYSPKIKPEHLARKAILYLRQSTEKQVRQNQESQRLQYDLGERMRALGWREVEIIGHDLGASGRACCAPSRMAKRIRRGSPRSAVRDSMRHPISSATRSGCLPTCIPSTGTCSP
jgi:hypothetical protein